MSKSLVTSFAKRRRIGGGTNVKIQKSIILNALPAGFSGSEGAMLAEIADCFIEEIKQKEVYDKITDKVIKVLACHMSIRAGDSLTRKDAETIIRELGRCEEPLRCPHGRPVMITLAISKIDSLLRR